MEERRRNEVCMRNKEMYCHLREQTEIRVCYASGYHACCLETCYRCKCHGHHFCWICVGKAESKLAQPDASASQAVAAVVQDEARQGRDQYSVAQGHDSLQREGVQPDGDTRANV